MTKEEKYELLTSQIKALVEGEDDAISIMANVSSAIQESMGFFWTGFYLEKNGQLRLGPFQGSVACYRIDHGKGVCGTAYEQKKSIVVPDVELFPGHIACSSLSRSEIVVPIFDAQKQVKGVLDIDSRELNTFDDTDRQYLENIVSIIAPLI
ncbi:MAG: GAF domain-containing protein [Prevotella sp.]|nr:GAF domain-containing protein [Prevotella sp.]